MRPTFYPRQIDGPNSHNVVVRVTDDDGQSDTDEARIDITNVAPVVEAEKYDDTEEESLFLGFGSFTDPGPDTWAGTVDFGDGSPVEEISVQQGQDFGIVFTHTYAENGSYTVTVTVRDDDGGSGSTSFVVQVRNVAPGINISGGSDFLDSTFDNDGTAASKFGGASEVNAVHLQPDGKILVANASFGRSERSIYVVRYNADGSLDQGFGTGGRIAINFGSLQNALEIEILSDGKILVAGNSVSSGDYRLFVSRFLADGTVDDTFGTGGNIEVDVLPDVTPGAFGYPVPEGITLQADGSIIIAGWAVFFTPTNTIDYDFLLVRLKPDGQLDTTFGNEGVVTTDFDDDPATFDPDFGYDVDVLPDGKIVVGGAASTLVTIDGFQFVDSSFAMARYNPDGSLDTDFGTGGRVVTNMARWLEDYGRDLVIEPDGKIILAGSAPRIFSTYDFAMTRYNPDGTLDSSFGVGGKVFTDFPGDGLAFDTAVAAARQADGRIVVVGSSENNFAAARYLPNGALDSSFGANGKVRTNLGGFDRALNVNLYSDGRILATGTTRPSFNEDAAFALARYVPGLVVAVAEGQPFSHAGSFTDPGADTWTATVDYGDGSGSQSLSLNADKSFTLNHLYAEIGTYTVTVTLFDDDRGFDVAHSTVVVINEPPTINAVANNGPVNETSSAKITVTAGGEGLRYEFDCENDGVYEIGPQAGTAASCSFGDDGAHLVNVRVTNPVGSATGFTVVTVKNLSPAITSVTNNGPVNESSGAVITVLATDPAGTNDPLQYEFDCDNNGSYEVGPQSGNSTSCVFSDNGSYVVNVRVTDGDGGEVMSSTTVTVHNAAPTISTVTNSGPVNEGSSAIISVIASDAAGANDPLQYQLDCNNDLVYEVGPQSDSSASCLFADQGSYQVNVRVTDGDGGVATGFTRVTVNNLAPTIASVVNNGPINEGTSAVVTVDATDPGGSNDPLSHQFDCDNNGTYERGPQSGNAASCSFADNGSYRVNVRVTDGDGGVATSLTMVTVENVAPTITSITNTGPINEASSTTITFRATDPAGSADTLRYEFDCNNDGVYDGGLQTGTIENDIQTSASKSCFFADNGAFQVNVRVSDEDGGSATGLTTVTVNNVAPTITSVTRTSPINEGSSSTITVAATDPAGANDPLSYQFDCNGDGIYERGPQSSNSAPCAFADNGSYQVNVRVTDGDGGVATGLTTVTVNNVAPTISSVGNNGPINEGSSAIISVVASDVAGANDPLQYQFDCNNDLVYEVGPQSGNSATCSFGDQGGQRVNVRVTDGDGGAATSFTTVMVNNVAPSIVSIANDGPVNEGSSAVVTVQATDPAGPYDTLNHEFDRNNDGLYEQATGATNFASCTFSDDGAFQVNVRVTDGDGGAATDFTTVTVNNVAPTISSVAAMSPINEGSDSAITVAATDPAGTSDPLIYEFDCNDDGTYETGQKSSNSASCNFTDDGTYQVNVRVSDGDDGVATGSASVVVDNVAPTLTISGPTSVDEAGFYLLDLAASDPGDDTIASWQINWGDGTIQTINGSPSSVSHIYADGPNDYTISGTATDEDGTFNSNTLAVHVNNVAPSASLTGPATGVRGQTRTFTLGATDSSALDQSANFTYSINWGDGTTSTVIGSSGISASHVYAQASTFTVSVTATDKDGSTGPTATSLIAVNAVDVQSDTCDPGQWVLAVGGTTAGDTIVISKGKGNALSVSINGVSQGSFTAPSGGSFSRLLGFGQAGNDDIRVSSISVPAWLYGDAGNDQLRGAAGADVLLGGEGDDHLVGNAGRDLLIGGIGADRIDGSDGDDILIAGRTAFDGDEAALCAIMREWSSARGYQTRVQNLADGTGSADRANQNYFLQSGSTVFRDDEIDLLTGAGGQDWFFFDPLKDSASDRQIDELFAIEMS